MPRIVDHEARRQELVLATWSLIREGGLAELTIRNLAAESGWSSGAVRYYLATRDEILDLAAREVNAAFERRARSVPDCDDPLEHLRSVIRAILPLDQASRDLCEVWLAFAGDSANRRARQRALDLIHDDLVDYLRGALTAMAADGHTLTLPVEQAARSLHAQIDGLTLHLLLDRVDAETALVSLDATLHQLVRRD